MRRVIVFLLLSTSYTRGASGLLQYGEINLVKKKTFAQFYSPKPPCPMRDASYILLYMFLSKHSSTALLSGTTAVTP